METNTQAFAQALSAPVATLPVTTPDVTALPVVADRVQRARIGTSDTADTRNPDAPGAGGARISVEWLYGQVVSGEESGRKKNTSRAYRQTLNDFAAAMKMDDALTALRFLLSLPQGPANALAAAYRTNLVERDLAAATVNARLNGLRSVVKDARRFGMVTWGLDVKSVRHKAYRDTAGPGYELYKSMIGEIEKDLASAAETARPRLLRDRAILRLLHDMALRAFEVAGIDMADVDFKAATLRIVGKGFSDRQAVAVPPKALESLKEWCPNRIESGSGGPLFQNLDRASQNAARGRRLSRTSVWRIVSAWGRRLGVKVWPHALRHSSISRLLDLTGGDVRRVQRFSRHAKVETLMQYDDNRRDSAGDLARMVSED